MEFFLFYFLLLLFWTPALILLILGFVLKKKKKIFFIFSFILFLPPIIFSFGKKLNEKIEKSRKIGSYISVGLENKVKIQLEKNGNLVVSSDNCNEFELTGTWNYENKNYGEYENFELIIDSIDIKGYFDYKDDLIIESSYKNNCLDLNEVILVKKI